MQKYFWCLFIQKRSLIFGPSLVCLSYQLMNLLHFNPLWTGHRSHTFPIPTIFNNIYITFFGPVATHVLQVTTYYGILCYFIIVSQSTHKLFWYVARLGNKFIVIVIVKSSLFNVCVNKVHCTCIYNTGCSEWTYQCSDGCIPISLYCIFYYTGCSEGTYQCSDGQCIPISLYCDFRKDCLDGSDEQNCGM